ncbi:DUF3267 domain-containing protein [Staphylococcus simiae]|uniref:Permease n=1 Tax=Staphylococcus simiae CCM 7213 = CCUG 51256 TaxID=911238 RepID=G5JFB7_9STAP|nr:DUF3267 domain-containing protein [Staphylococcus simiae]EHJ09113.1 hypothetical protein SS7213T_00568 [Staphylococcus simiae CCM 7213 = CCUG 51256]PNZ13384.1 DUF3267 domain-containing protein [Staphylococcus simiae]SNV76110.1 Permease [Staphylococcus simiae]
MHKIDLSDNNFNIRRFIVVQMIIALFVILFTYKWALDVTAIIDQNIIVNLIYGFLGFVIVLVVHELIHRILFIIFKKDCQPMLQIKKGNILFHTSNACYNKWQFSIIMLAPFIIINSALLILIKQFGYSSIIFIFSMHTAYCLIDLLLVTFAMTSNFKYVQQDTESLYLYNQKPIQ